jgi:hypothetical protein
MKESGAVFADSLSSLQSLVKDWGASIQGTPKIVWSAFGPVISFKGSPDTIQLPVPILQLGTSDFSFAFWIRVDTTSDHEQLYSKIVTGQAGIDILMRNTGRLGAFIRDEASGGAFSPDDGAIIDDGTWRHVVITFDRDGDMIRYVDGVVYGSAISISGESGSLDNTTEAYFGSLSGSSRFLIGEIRDPVVFNRVLTAGEAMALAKNEWYKWLWYDDLQFSADLREDAVARIEAGEPAEADPSVLGVSPNGYFRDYLATRLVEATLNTPRIEQAGMLFENLHTNRLIRASEFDLWTNVNIVVASGGVDSVLAPDGTLTGDRLKNTAVSGDHYFWQSQAFTSGQKVMLSVFVSIESGRYVGLELPAAAFPGNPYAAFLGGSVYDTVDVDGYGTETFVHAGTTWYRYWIVATADASVSGNCQIWFLSNSRQKNYTGTNLALRFWGADLGLGESFPSSFVLTTTGDTTRTAEDLRYDNTAERNLSAAVSSIAFCVTTLFDGDQLINDAYAFDFSTGTDGPRGFFDQSNGGRLTIEWLSGGAVVATLVALTAPVKGTTYRVITGGKVNDFFLNINGVEQAIQGAPAAAPIAVNSELFVGQDRLTANQLYGSLSYVRIWKRTLGVRERVVYDIEQAVRIAA